MFLTPPSPPAHDTENVPSPPLRDMTGVNYSISSLQSGERFFSPLAELLKNHLKYFRFDIVFRGEIQIMTFPVCTLFHSPYSHNTVYSFIPVFSIYVHFILGSLSVLYVEFFSAYLEKTAKKVYEKFCR